MERIPILKMGEFLLVTIQVDMHDQLAMTLQDDLTERIVGTRARGVLIDISALEIVDSFIGRMLGNIASMSRMLDAETVVVGMRPAVAITLVELGLTLTGVRTALNVEAGMELLRDTIENGQHGRRLPEMRRGRSAAPEDVVQVRQLVRAWAVEMGFSLVDQTKIVTAASELARNTVVYGGGGTMRIEAVSRRRAARAPARVRGQGPGHRGHRARDAGRLHHRRGARPRAERRQAAVQRVRDPVAGRRGHPRQRHALAMTEHLDALGLPHRRRERCRRGPAPGRAAGGAPRLRRGHGGRARPSW